MSSYNIKYDEAKWLQMEKAVQDLYSSHPDPRSAIAAYSVSNIISDAFPNISKVEARRNSSAIIENFTGYKLDSEGAFKEAWMTLKAQKEDLDISMMFSNIMLSGHKNGTDSTAYKNRVSKAMETLNSKKLTYRNDFKDMSVFTDLLTESARLIPSMIPTIGMYLAGGLLSGVTGGASLGIAKVAGAAYSGMMEAGGVAKELYGLKDDNGNRLDDEYIIGAWMITMAGVSALNLFTDKFEQFAGGVAKSVLEGATKAFFGKQATKQLVKSGALGQWGKRILMDYAVKGIAGEALEEALEELIGMQATNWMLGKSNKEIGTVFDKYSKDEIVSAMAQVAGATAKGMLLTGIPPVAMNAIRDYRNSDSSLKRHANKYTNYTEDSYVLSVNDIKTPTAVNAKKDIDGKVDPIKVAKIGEKYKPIDAENASILAGLKRNGAKAVNVEIVESSSTVTKESVLNAQVLAQRLGTEAKGEVVLFDSEEEMRSAAEKHGMDSERVVGYHESGGKIILDLKGDDGLYSIILQTKESFEAESKLDSSANKTTDATNDATNDAKVDSVEYDQEDINETDLYVNDAALSQQEQELANHETLPAPQEVVRKQYRHYERTLKRRGASDADTTFLNTKILPKIAEVLKKQFPNLTSEQIYQTAIPSTYFAFLASKVAGMDVETFFDKHFSPEMFIGLSDKEVDSFLNSKTGKKSIDVQLGGKGRALLGGLLIPSKDGKYTIALGNNHDPLVVVHELGHLLVNVIKDTDQFKPFLDIYSAELELDGGKIGMNFQEAFARDLEAYITNGKLRDGSLATIFRNMRDAILEFIDYILPQLDDKTRIALDRLFDIKQDMQQDIEQDGYVQLDLFGNPDEAVNTLASLDQEKLATRPVPFRTLESIVEKFKTLKDKEVPHDWNKGWYIGKYWFWYRNLKPGLDYKGDQITLAKGPVTLSYRNINHILLEHGHEGVTHWHITKIAEELANPMMVLESSSTDKNNKGWPLFVTKYVVEYNGEYQPLVIAVRNVDRTQSLGVYSMFPWKPYMNGGMSIEDAALSGKLMAINIKNIEKGWQFFKGGEDSTNVGNEIESIPNSYTRLRSAMDLQGYSPNTRVVNLSLSDKQLEYNNYRESLQPTLASIKGANPIEYVKEQLQNHHYPSDDDLDAHRGDPDVDWEIQFRRILMQDPDAYKAFLRALDKAEKYAEEGVEVTPQMVLDMLDKHSTTAAFGEMVGEVKDALRFIERMMWQEKYLSPTEADRKFRLELSEQKNLIKVIRTLLKGEDMFSFNSQFPPEFFLLRDRSERENITQNSINRARAAIREDIRLYRRLYYEKAGMDAQLSYESTVEGSFLDGGNQVEAFKNEEISRILNDKNADPVLKSLIRRNLATGDVLSTLINETTSQIDALSSELESSINETKAATEALSDAETKIGEVEAENEQLGKEHDRLDAKYRNLQKKNALNSSQKRMYKKLNDLKAKRIEYMKLSKEVDRTVESISRTANSKSNQNDAKIMRKLRNTIEILFSSQGQDLEGEFEKRGMTVADIPDQLLRFFNINEDGVFAENIATRMDIKSLIDLDAATAAVRREAKAEKAMRDAERSRATFKIVQDYLMESKGLYFETEAEYDDYMTQQKYEGNVKDSKNKAKSFFETKFLTMSRILDRIDPTQKSLKTFVFGGYDRDGNFHRGLEGVIDDSKRKEHERYSAMKDVMKHFGITEKALLKHHISLSAGDLTLDQALGVYIYSQQQDGLKKLISPDGNKLVVLYDEEGNVIKNEVDEVIASLDSDQKAFADWMIEDMESRYDATAEVYYKVHNKELGKVARYFPFIGTGQNISITDLMEDQYLAMQETPADSHTKVRRGGDYELQLNAVSVWNRMVAKQEHYIAGAEFFNTMNWAMNKNGGDLYNLIAINSGEQYAKSFQDFLNRTANRRFVYDDADAMVNKVRSNLLVARLGFNILTVAKQVPTIGLFAMEFGPVRLLEAISHITTDYKGVSEFIYEKSPQMRTHSSSIDFSAFAQMETSTEFGRVVKRVGEIGMSPIQFMDGLVKKTLWYGAYQNNIAKGMTDQHAAMEATKYINETQPGGMAKDNAAIYNTNSTMMKFLLMFTNQLNKNMNIAYDIPYAIKNKMYSKALMNTLGLGLSLAGIMVLEGGYSDDDDDDKVYDDFLKNFSGQLMSMLPIFGPDAADIIMDRYYSDSGLPMLSETNSFIKAVGSGEKDRIIDRGANLGLGAMELTGLPSGQMKKIWDAFNKEDAFNYRYLFGRDFVE